MDRCSSVAKRSRLSRISKRRTGRPASSVRNAGSSTMIPTTLSAIPDTFLLVGCIVGVDDFLLDPASRSDVHTLGLRPGADLSDIVATTRTGATPRRGRTWAG